MIFKYIGVLCIMFHTAHCDVRQGTKAQCLVIPSRFLGYFSAVSRYVATTDTKVSSSFCLCARADTVTFARVPTDTV